MTRYNIIIAVLSGILIALGASTAISWTAKKEVDRDRRDINSLVLKQCSNTRTTAEVAREALVEQKEENTRLLPRIEIPGLTHKELIELSEKKSQREGARILRLDAIATENCKGD